MRRTNAVIGLLNLDEETWRERAAAFAITDAR